MASSNPALNDKVFQREISSSRQGGGFSPAWGSPADELPPGVFGQRGPGATPPTAYAPGGGGAGPITDDQVMRVSGTASATAILLALLMVAAWVGWQSVTVTVLGTRPDGTVDSTFSMPAWLWVSWIVGLVLAIVTIVKPKVARFTAPLYSVAQGLLVGAISRAYEIQFEGIVLQAILLTLAVFTIMLVLFASGAIKVTDKLRTGILVATGAVALVYVFDIVLRLFGSGVPMIHEASLFGIGFSLLVVGIAAFNLLIDFDFVQRAVAARAPRYLEWFAAFGLMLTLIWLYLEILRLLAKLRER